MVVHFGGFSCGLRTRSDSLKRAPTESVLMFHQKYTCLVRYIILVIYVAFASARKCGTSICIASYDPVCGGPLGGLYATFSNTCQYEYAKCVNGNGTVFSKKKFFIYELNLPINR